MSEKPSYLGLLNAVALGEARAAKYLQCWIEVTPNDEVRSQLRTIALREAEHAAIFEKRLDELGFGLVEMADPDGGRAMEIAASTTMTDREKLKTLKLHRRPTNGTPDVFDNFFANKDLDPVTAGLLGRYVAEERDSLRRFNDCYELLAGTEEPSATKSAKSAKSATKSKKKAGAKKAS